MALGLQECYELAVLASETLGVSREDVRIAEARYWQALATAMPNVHAVGEQEWRDTLDRAPAYGGGDDRETFNVKIKATQTLFNGFREWQGMRAAEYDRAARQQNLRRLRQLLYQDVADMFYQTLAEERQLRIAGENVETLQRRVQELERRVELGKSRPAEQLQARADWLDSRAQREELVGALTASRELLAFLTRVPADRLKLRDDSPLPEPGVLRDWIQHAMGRPDLQAARDNERASQKAIDATVAEYSPTVSVSGSYTPYADPKAERDWSAMLTVDMPIFEGHITAARIKERKAQLRQRQLDLAMLERSSMKEVRAAHARFISAAAELERLREFEAVAIENMEAQKADYERGAASNLDYLTAVNRMHQAKIRLAGGESRARTLWARLICAAGETPAVQEIP